MIATPASGHPTSAVPAGGLEVRTVSSDTLRAAVVITGSVSERTVPLLLSVLGTHVRAGRRYLRVDLAAADLDHQRVLTCLIQAHQTLVDLGGMLVFDNADDQLADILRGSHLHAAPRG